MGKITISETIISIWCRQLVWFATLKITLDVQEKDIFLERRERDKETEIHIERDTHTETETERQTEHTCKI